MNLVRRWRAIVRRERAQAVSLIKSRRTDRRSRRRARAARDIENENEPERPEADKGQIFIDRQRVPQGRGEEIAGDADENGDGEPGRRDREALSCRSDKRLPVRLFGPNCGRSILVHLRTERALRGLCPVQRLNARENEAGSEKPTR